MIWQCFCNNESRNFASWILYHGYLRKGTIVASFALPSFFHGIAVYLNNSLKKGITPLDGQQVSRYSKVAQMKRKFFPKLPQYYYPNIHLAKWYLCFGQSLGKKCCFFWLFAEFHQFFCSKSVRSGCKIVDNLFSLLAVLRAKRRKNQWCSSRVVL